MKRVSVIVFVLLAGIIGAFAGSGRVTLRSMPPVVTRTVPEAGSTDVDPKLTEIEVTFSKKMRNGAWSWVVVSEDSWPTKRGEPRYLRDRRTCVLPVRLEPGKTYAVAINSERFKNFEDLGGRPALPYVLVFRTSNR